MAEDNVKAQMRKGILAYCILAILSRGDSYAPRIIAELKAAEMIVVEGTKEKTLRLHAVAALRTTEGAVSDGGRRDMTTGGVESLRNHTRSIRNRHKPITP